MTMHGSRAEPIFTGADRIRDAYRDAAIAHRYVRERFEHPLGRLLHRQQMKIVRSLVAAQQPGEVLEIAPGPARLTVDIASVLREGVTLIDTSMQMLAEARRALGNAGHRCHLIQGDAFQLPFARQFDFVYSFRFIRHFGDEDRQRLYAQIARALRSRGLFVFDAVNARAAKPVRECAPAGAYCHYDALMEREALVAELQAANLEPLALHGAQRRFRWLYQIQVLLGPRAPRVARLAIELVDRFGGGEPLEWIVVCRRA